MRRVLARQRQERIIEEVRRRGGVRVSDLTRLFDVSDMTIRRDLETLARRGLLEKVHGGATPLAPGRAAEPEFAVKARRETSEKEAIADSAAALVAPGSAIGLTAGTTTWTLAQHLVDVPGLTVVTNSIRVADMLYHNGRADQTVVLTGGMRTPSDALVGPVAVAALQALKVDLLFMGVHGMDTEAGFTTPNLLEAETNRAMRRSAQRLAVLADRTKWGVVGLASIAPLDAADVLVTDSGTGPPVRELLEARVGALVLADPGPDSGPDEGESEKG